MMEDFLGHLLRLNAPKVEFLMIVGLVDVSLGTIQQFVVVQCLALRPEREWTGETPKLPAYIGGLEAGNTERIASWYRPIKLFRGTRNFSNEACVDYSSRTKQIKIGQKKQ